MHKVQNKQFCFKNQCFVKKRLLMSQQKCHAKEFSSAIISFAFTCHALRSLSSYHISPIGIIDLCLITLNYKVKMLGQE